MAEKKGKSNLEQPFYAGCKPINPKYCKTCWFSHGKPPFADRPEKMYCEVFTREDGVQKPSDVYYNGAKCPAYKEDPTL